MIRTKIPPHLAEEWVRLPSRPEERYEGLSRTTLLELHAAGEIQIAAVRKPGSQKAIRLVHVPSLKNFLRTCVEAPADNPSPGKKTVRCRPKEQPTQQLQPTQDTGLRPAGKAK
jgi:hypothetical protein